MLPSSLLPNSPFIRFCRLEKREDCFVVHLQSKMKHGICPDCGTENGRKHSSYIRKLLDLPWAGIPVRVLLSVRKLRCDNSGCQRKLFTERLGEELKPFARRTSRLNEHLNEIGFALGGNAGSKLASFIGMPVSRCTMLRVILNTDDEQVTTPRVLGVDDWAFRKGKNYGTILVDLEKNKPIDLLADREAETLEKWLKVHPGIEIISRDRAGCYAKGAKAGAPDAIQVADRWHLLKNLGDALKRMLDKHNHELRLAAKDIAEAKRDEKQSSKEQNDQALPVEVKKQQHATNPAVPKFELNFREVKRLHGEGNSIKSIFRQTGIHRQTIKKYLKYEEYPKPYRLSNVEKINSQFDASLLSPAGLSYFVK